MESQEPPAPRAAHLTNSLRRVVLLRETGPKSAAWHRARVQTIWRLHRLLEEAAPIGEAPPAADASAGDSGERPPRGA
ncbi:MAG: hypothetical protein OHK0015_48370 [Chloroflexi bacterium OHK40]